MADPRILLAGNPNSGKTSLFNRLTGLDLKVGNYPGVTVDRHEGSMRVAGTQVCLEDLPGAYSLSSNSAEEQIAIQAITGQSPFLPAAAIVLVLDSTQLRRSLYLGLQVAEMGVPLICALNMTDQLRGQGREIDTARLAERLGAEVVPIVARTGEGLPELEQALARTLANGQAPKLPAIERNPALEEALRKIAGALPEAVRENPVRARALARWSLLSLEEEDELTGVPPALRAAALEERGTLERSGLDVDLELIRPRFEWIDREVGTLIRETGGAQRPAWSERLDRVLLHPLLGLPLFVLVMGLIFQSLFAWSDPAIGFIEESIGWATAKVESSLDPSLLREFLTEGLLAGVGSVIVFLPQILLLFVFLGCLEASGYMSRVAWLMDRLMRAMGLSGRAFVPMLSGFACAIPAIMATRTMERRRDRIKTMMVVPLMTCSARLPVYTLVLGTLFPTTEWLGLSAASLLMVAMYLFATMIALAAAAVLSRTVLEDQPAPLVFELPPYRVPQALPILRTSLQSGGAFLREAGGPILLATIALWGLLSFPRAEAEANSAEEAVAAQLEDSYAGTLGRSLEPALAPLGFDWRIGVGLLGSFAAREVFVSTMGMVHGAGGDVDEESSTLRERMQAAEREDGSPLYTPLVGLSLLVFFALACQCISTIAVVKRETGGWRWPSFLFAYMTALAWIASFVVYQAGRLLGFS